MPCTTILAGKKATADGSTLIARNEDFSTAFNPKRFVVVTPDTQPKNYQSVTSKCKVDLPANPLRYTALPQANIKTMGIWAEGGINAANVCMSATETSTTNRWLKQGLVKKTLLRSFCHTFIVPAKGFSCSVPCWRSTGLTNQTGWPSLIRTKYGTWKRSADTTGQPSACQTTATLLRQIGLALLTLILIGMTR